MVKHHTQYIHNLYDSDFEAWKAVRKVIREYQPTIVGVSTVTSSYPSSVQVAKIAKEECPDAVIVFGGSHSTALPEESLRIADIVVIGEGELTMREIAEGVEPQNIDGIAFKSPGGAVIKTPPRVFIKDIDTIFRKEVLEWKRNS